MTSSAGSLSRLRRRNRLQVLAIVRQRGTTSRAAIAKQAGLATTTVSTLVGELLQEGIVVEVTGGSGAAGGAGRPARMLAFNPSAGGAVGIHLAHNHIRVGVTDLADKLVSSAVTEFDVDHEPTRTLQFAADTALNLIGEAGLEPANMVGIGVAVSAPVAAASHAVDSSRILPNWRGIHVAEELSRRTGLHVELGNDANLGAIAEHRFGVAQNVDDFVYVMLSDGVGAGLVLNGQLYEGAIGQAGELGHVTVAPGGYVCRCGNRGCLETVAGAHALAAALTQTQGAGMLLPDVLASAGSGDHGARRVLADAGRAVGRSLLPICTMLDSALVVVGGECAASDVLLDGIREEVTRGMTPLRMSPIPVRPGTLGTQAEMLGAAVVASRRMSIA